MIAIKLVWVPQEADDKTGLNIGGINSLGEMPIRSYRDGVIETKESSEMAMKA